VSLQAGAHDLLLWAAEGVHQVAGLVLEVLHVGLQVVTAGLDSLEAAQLYNKAP
jgi:hypothetical protein